ncbi:MAG: hypothetical protein JW953_11600 [Anaerolineae bacterium]|nr:hypothetical protein [Anaerolineae bacterium]
MATVLSILAIIVGIGSLVCWIMVLIKLFQEKGVLHGILGIICALYPFIWGWMNVTRLNIKNVMIVWSVCVVLGIILNGAATSMTASQF